MKTKKALLSLSLLISLLATSCVTKEEAPIEKKSYTWTPDPSSKVSQTDSSEPPAMDMSFEEVEPTFKPLFNGSHFDDWYFKFRNPNNPRSGDVFTAENGHIHIFKDFPDGYGFDDDPNATHGMMYTDADYDYYILRFEYKWGETRTNNFDQYQYDSGVYYHVVNDQIWPEGIEYQVRYNHELGRNHSGDFWAYNISWFSADGKTFEFPANGGVITENSGEHRCHESAPYNALNGKWNTVEIIVMGSNYAIHKLNGQVVNFARDLPYASGKIGFQSETAEIFYRNLEISEFPGPVPIERFIDSSLLK